MPDEKTLDENVATTLSPTEEILRGLVSRCDPDEPTFRPPLTVITGKKLEDVVVGQAVYIRNLESDLHSAKLMLSMAAEDINALLKHQRRANECIKGLSMENGKLMEEKVDAERRVADLLAKKRRRSNGR